MRTRSPLDRMLSDGFLLAHASNSASAKRGLDRRFARFGVSKRDNRGMWGGAGGPGKLRP